METGRQLTNKEVLEKRKNELTDLIMGQIFTDGRELFFSADSLDYFDEDSGYTEDDIVTDANLVDWFNERSEHFADDFVEGD